MAALGDLYREGRERVIELVRDLPEADASIQVPATPGWSVRDVVAHLSGLAADWNEGRVEGYGSDPWTATQVEARKDRSFPELLEEWAKESARLEPMLDGVPDHGFPEFMPYLAISDVAVHEHDIRGALGRAGGWDSGGIRLGVKTYITGFRQRHAATDLPPMLVRETDGREWPIGTGGSPAAVVAAPRFELFRALSGRRSRSQFLSYDWDGDPEPYVDLFLAPAFSWADRDLDH